jgi:hypothetical protein
VTLLDSCNFFNKIIYFLAQALLVFPMPLISLVKWSLIGGLWVAAANEG